MERINFSTQVDSRSNGFRLNHGMNILMMGSCFAEHIGQRLQENKFSVLTNPFGILYNPKSIFSSLELLINWTEIPKPLTKKDIFFDGNLWNSWIFSSKFSATNSENCLEHINQSLEDASTWLNKTDVIIITLGTSHCYQLKENHACVANCHKQPSGLFYEKILTIEEITTYTSTIQKLLNLRPGLQIIFTISPYRYAKYGLHQNQISKATLLLSIDQFCKEFSNNTHYFPAYEILNDELRDYRYYADDMLHPSSVAIDYIWNIFQNEWLSPEAILFISEWKPIVQSLSHRPFNKETMAYKKFIENLQRKIIGISKHYTTLSFTNELREITNK